MEPMGLPASEGSDVGSIWDALAAHLEDCRNKGQPAMVEAWVMGVGQVGGEMQSLFADGLVLRDGRVIPFTAVSWFKAPAREVPVEAPQDEIFPSDDAGPADAMGLDDGAMHSDGMGIDAE